MWYILYKIILLNQHNCDHITEDSIQIQLK